MRLTRSTLAALVALAAALTAPLAACDGGVACTQEARASVTVTVVDAEAKPVPDAVVTFTLDGGPVRQAECWGPDPDACDSWVAGVEEAGVFVISATSADGTLSAEATVTVKAGECHVDGQTVELVLM